MRLPSSLNQATPSTTRLTPVGSLRLAVALGVVIAVGLAASPAVHAQRRGAGGLAGRVIDQINREPIAGVRVQLVGTRVAAFTDSSGYFGMQGLPNGEVTFEARAIGYRMQRWQIVLPVGTTVERVFEMARLDLALDTVEVSAPPDQNWRSPNAFDRRRRRGIGYFITREMIDERQANTVTDLLQIVPGMLTSCRRGFCDVQMMASGQNCRPEWFLDGHPASNATGWDFPARTIGAIEIYRSLFEVPPEFQRSNLRCGVIAIWSR